MKLAHRFFTACLRRDAPNVAQRIDVVAVVAADETDVGRDQLRTRALVAANHRRSRHERLGHAQTKCFINSRRKNESFRSCEQLCFSLAAYVADVMRANLPAQSVDSH